MRTLLAFILVCLSAQAQMPPPPLVSSKRAAAGGGGGGGIALVSSTIKGHATTDAIDTTGANLIVIGLSWYSDAPSVSDSKGNTWTALSTYGSSPYLVRLFYCLNPSVGGSHTFSTTANIYVLNVAAFSGVTAFDAESGAGNGNATTIQPGSITPAVASGLFITALCFAELGTTASINSTFTILNGTSDAGGNNLLGSMAYKISSSAENPTWTKTGGNNEVNAAMATFKP
jgi:hypothetical protein